MYSDNKILYRGVLFYGHLFVGMPLFGFTPPLPPFFLPRGLPLPPPPPPTPPLAPHVAPSVPSAPHVDPADLLRSLGPVQDSPMDLRLKREEPPRRSPNAAPPHCSPPPAAVHQHRTNLQVQQTVSSQVEKKTPLDLTCVKT